VSENDGLDTALAAQQLQLEAARARVDELHRTITKSPPTGPRPPLEVPDPGEYDALVVACEVYLRSIGRTGLALEDTVDAGDLRILRVDAKRLHWSPEDILTVGLCGLVGSVAALLAGAVDQRVAESLQMFEGTDLIHRWKRETTNLPIDYNGAVVGGPAHRISSAGHDIGRPVAAIRQIVQGQYRGTGWLLHQKVTRTPTGTPTGTPFDAVPDIGLAASLWVKHLVTDVLTPTSLPLPG
jgi:hypothetical protein